MFYDAYKWSLLLKKCPAQKKGQCASCLLHMKRLPPAALLQQRTPAVWTRHALTSAGRQATVNHRGVTFSIARSLQILQCIMLQHLYAHSWGDRISLTQKLFVLGWLARRCRSVRVQSKSTLKTEQIHRACFVSLYLVAEHLDFIWTTHTFSIFSLRLFGL